MPAAPALIAVYLPIPLFRSRQKPSLIDKAAKQQYPTLREESALVDCILRISERGYFLPVKILRPLALVIARLRPSASRNCL
jgi:hypothetical protein